MDLNKYLKQVVLGVSVLALAYRADEIGALVFGLALLFAFGITLIERLDRPQSNDLTAQVEKLQTQVQELILKRNSRS